MTRSVSPIIKVVVMAIMIMMMMLVGLSLARPPGLDTCRSLRQGRICGPRDVSVQSGGTELDFVRHGGCQEEGGGDDGEDPSCDTVPNKENCLAACLVHAQATAQEGCCFFHPGHVSSAQGSLLLEKFPYGCAYFPNQASTRLYDKEKSWKKGPSRRGVSPSPTTSTPQQEPVYAARCDPPTLQEVGNAIRDLHEGLIIYTAGGLPNGFESNDWDHYKYSGFDPLKSPRALYVKSLNFKALTLMKGVSTHLFPLLGGPLGLGLSIAQFTANEIYGQLLAQVQLISQYIKELRQLLDSSFQNIVIQVGLVDARAELDEMLHRLKVLELDFDAFSSASNSTVAEYSARFRHTCNNPAFSPSHIFRYLYGHVCTGCTAIAGGRRNFVYFLHLFEEAARQIEEIDSGNRFRSGFASVMLMALARAQLMHFFCLPLTEATDGERGSLWQRELDDMAVAFDEATDSLILSEASLQDKSFSQLCYGYGSYHVYYRCLKTNGNGLSQFRLHYDNLGGSDSDQWKLTSSLQLENERYGCLQVDLNYDLSFGTCDGSRGQAFAMDEQGRIQSLLYPDQYLATGDINSKDPPFMAIRSHGYVQKWKKDAYQNHHLEFENVPCLDRISGTCTANAGEAPLTTIEMDPTYSLSENQRGCFKACTELIQKSPGQYGCCMWDYREVQCQVGYTHSAVESTTPTFEEYRLCGTRPYEVGLVGEDNVELPTCEQNETSASDLASGLSTSTESFYNQLEGFRRNLPPVDNGQERRLVVGSLMAFAFASTSITLDFVKGRRDSALLKDIEKNLNIIASDLRAMERQMTEGAAWVVGEIAVNNAFLEVDKYLGRLEGVMAAFEMHAGSSDLAEDLQREHTAKFARICQDPDFYPLNIARFLYSNACNECELFGGARNISPILSVLENHADQTRTLRGAAAMRHFAIQLVAAMPRVMAAFSMCLSITDVSLCEDQIWADRLIEIGRATQEMFQAIDMAYKRLFWSQFPICLAPSFNKCLTRKDSSSVPDRVALEKLSDSDFSQRAFQHWHIDVATHIIKYPSFAFYLPWFGCLFVTEASPRARLEIIDSHDHSRKCETIQNSAWGYNNVDGHIYLEDSPHLCIGVENDNSLVLVRCDGSTPDISAASWG